MRNLYSSLPSLLRLAIERDAPLPYSVSNHLDPVTVREVFGKDPDPHDLGCVRFEVLAAVRRLEAGIRRGVLPPRQLVRHRPLCDWLDLEEVARLLRAWREREARP